jgi:hypothetical protein
LSRADTDNRDDAVHNEAGDEYVTSDHEVESEGRRYVWSRNSFTQSPMPNNQFDIGIPDRLSEIANFLDQVKLISNHFKADYQDTTDAGPSSSQPSQQAPPSRLSTPPSPPRGAIERGGEWAAKGGNPEGKKRCSKENGFCYPFSYFKKKGGKSDKYYAECRYCYTRRLAKKVAEKPEKKKKSSLADKVRKREGGR